MTGAERRRAWLLAAAVGALHVAGFGVLFGLVARRHLPGFPVGIGITAYTLGLRHAFDADHIGAIDNTTRKLMADGQRPVSIGFFFSVGVAEAVANKISSIVFLDAFIPDNGESLLDVVQPAVQDVIQDVLDRGDTTVPVRDAAAFKVNEKDRPWVDSLATPQPIGTTTEKITLTGARERVATKAYIRAAGYPNVSFDKACARTKADRSWRTYEVPCGHDVMIDKPDRLAEILLEVA